MVQFESVTSSAISKFPLPKAYLYSGYFRQSLIYSVTQQQCTISEFLFDSLITVEDLIAGSGARKNAQKTPQLC
jgi:hypothetical protein